MKSMSSDKRGNSISNHVSGANTKTLTKNSKLPGVTAISSANVVNKHSLFGNSGKDHTTTSKNFIGENISDLRSGSLICFEKSCSNLEKPGKMSMLGSDLTSMKKNRKSTDASSYNSTLKIKNYFSPPNYYSNRNFFGTRTMSSNSSEGKINSSNSFGKSHETSNIYMKSNIKTHDLSIGMESNNANMKKYDIGNKKDLILKAHTASDNNKGKNNYLNEINKTIISGTTIYYKNLSDAPGNIKHNYEATYKKRIKPEDTKNTCVIGTSEKKNSTAGTNNKDLISLGKKKVSSKVSEKVSLIEINKESTHSIKKPVQNICVVGNSKKDSTTVELTDYDCKRVTSNLSKKLSLIEICKENTHSIKKPIEEMFKPIPLKKDTTDVIEANTIRHVIITNNKVIGSHKDNFQKVTLLGNNSKDLNLKNSILELAVGMKAISDESFKEKRCEDKNDKPGSSGKINKRPETINYALNTNINASTNMKKEKEIEKLLEPGIKERSSVSDIINTIYNNSKHNARREHELEFMNIDSNCNTCGNAGSSGISDDRKNNKKRSFLTFDIIWIPGRRRKHKEMIYKSYNDDYRRSPSMNPFMSGDSTDNQPFKRKEEETELIVSEKSKPAGSLGGDFQSIDEGSDVKQEFIRRDRDQDDSKEAAGDRKEDDRENNKDDNDDYESNDVKSKGPKKDKVVDKVDSVYLRPAPAHKARSNPSTVEDEEDCAMKCLYYTLQCCDCVLM